MSSDYNVKIANITRRKDNSRRLDGLMLSELRPKMVQSCLNKDVLTDFNVKFKNGETVEHCNYFCKPYKDGYSYDEKKYPVGTKCLYGSKVSWCTEEGCPYPKDSADDVENGKTKPEKEPNDQEGKQEENGGEEKEEQEKVEEEKKEEENEEGEKGETKGGEGGVEEEEGGKTNANEGEEEEEKEEGEGEVENEKGELEGGSTSETSDT